MKKEKNGPVNKSRNSNAKLILGTLLGIIIGTLSTLFLSGYIIISIPIFITVSFVLVVFIVLLIIFVSFYKDIWIEKIFGEKLEIDQQDDKNNQYKGDCNKNWNRYNYIT
ncbi:MAG: hypothetical protein AAFR87_33980, partial [Bacteroidota bacterium]